MVWQRGNWWYFKKCSVLADRDDFAGFGSCNLKIPMLYYKTVA